MNSIPEIHRLLSMGVITPNEARQMLNDLTWYASGGFPPGTFAQEQAAIEVIERAQQIRDARDGNLDTTKENR
jgi:hypothetical protein